MSNIDTIKDLANELVDLFDDGNIEIVEQYYDEYSLAAHPDVIRAQEIISELKSILNK